MSKDTSRKFLDANHPMFRRPWVRWATGILPLAWGDAGKPCHQRARDASRGYARDFVDQLDEVMALALERGVDLLDQRAHVLGLVAHRHHHRNAVEVILRDRPLGRA